MARTGRAQLYIRQVESDIRFRIDELFRENHLVIAFPQRDVHLDTHKPLEIRINKE
jgi:small-conductance mechanosensitive channel